MTKSIYLSAKFNNKIKPNKQNIKEIDLELFDAALDSVLRVVLGRKRLVWLGDPMTSVFIEIMASGFKVDYDKWIKVYQPVEKREEILKIGMNSIKNVDFVDTPDGQSETIKNTFEKMINDNDISHAVFIGGDSTTLDEYQLLKERSPDTKIISITSTGGATTKIADLENLKPGDRFEVYYEYLEGLRKQLEIDTAIERQQDDNVQPLFPKLVEKAVNSHNAKYKKSKKGQREKLKKLEVSDEWIKKSIAKNYIICFEDGEKTKELDVYIKEHFDMTPSQYRTKWGLPRNYPMKLPVGEKTTKTRKKNTVSSYHTAVSKTINDDSLRAFLRRAVKRAHLITDFSDDLIAIELTDFSDNLIAIERAALSDDLNTVERTDLIADLITDLITVERTVFSEGLYSNGLAALSDDLITDFNISTRVTLSVPELTALSANLSVAERVNLSIVLIAVEHAASNTDLSVAERLTAKRIAKLVADILSTEHPITRRSTTLRRSNPKIQRQRSARLK